jgi:hypothetical protein
MARHKLLAFTPSTDSNMYNIVQENLNYVIQHLDIDIEHVNETDSRLSRYVINPTRFPIFMLFKGDTLKTYVNAKFYSQQLLDWVISKSG